MPEFVSLSLGLFFAWLFGVSGWHKLQHRAYYRQLLSSWFSRAPGRASITALAALELASAAALLFTVSRSHALVVVALLLLMYAAAMAWQLLRGRSGLDCGCSGPAADTSISWSLVGRNLVCAQIAVLAANTTPAGGLHILEGVVALLLAAFLCLLYLCFEQLLSNSQHFALENK